MLKEDAETIFERAWRFLHGDKPLPELKSFCDSSQCSVFDVDKVEKQDAIVTDVITCKTGIKSPTHDRLQRAIDAFSSRYPERFVRPPKLDTDIRPWLNETGMALSDREAHVFGVILAEHFNLSPDTQKP